MVGDGCRVLLSPLAISSFELSLRLVSVLEKQEDKDCYESLLTGATASNFSKQRLFKQLCVLFFLALAITCL